MGFEAAGGDIEGEGEGEEGRVEGEISPCVKAKVISPFGAAAQKGDQLMDKQTYGWFNGRTDGPTNGMTDGVVEMRSMRLIRKMQLNKPWS